MAGVEIIPALVRGVDSRLVSIVSSAWVRRQSAGMWWKRVARPRPSETGTEYIQWLLETARIHPMGRGGRNIFSDFAATNMSITNTEFGDDLLLKQIDILNALGGQNGAEKNALVLSEVWGRQMGGQGAWWPQFQTAGVMVGGATIGVSGGAAGITSAVPAITGTSYDGLSFFNTAHWINPVTKATTGGPSGNGTFCNLFYGRPLTADNYAKIGAYIESIPAPDGYSRKIKPRVLATGTGDRYNANQILNAQSVFYTDPNNAAGAAAASNITKILYDVEEPVIDADLNIYGQQAGTWWIVADLVEDDELAGVVYQERLPYRLNTYASESDSNLANSEEYRWKFRGWNATSGGHPFLLFCCRPDTPVGQTAWSPP
jgi:hypothetical protein